MYVYAIYGYVYILEINIFSKCVLFSCSFLNEPFLIVIYHSSSTENIKDLLGSHTTISTLTLKSLNTNTAVETPYENNHSQPKQKINPRHSIKTHFTFYIIHTSILHKHSTHITTQHY